MDMKAFFVTGTGTDIGKTYVAAGLIRASRRAGRQANAIKPIMTGYESYRPDVSDAGRLLEAMEKKVTAESVAAISPWRYAAPISPDMAAAMEGRTISLPQLLTFCEAAIKSAPGLMLVEGVGGVMVPLDRWHTVRDWIAGLHIPAILVAGSYLGSISHILTAAEALNTHAIKIAAVVISESDISPVRPEDIASTITKFLPRTAIQIVHRMINDAEFEKLAWLLD
jgi:dethiobiotin synthetase